MNRNQRLQWFKDLSTALASSEQNAFDLLLQLKLDAQMFEQIRNSALQYIISALGLSGISCDGSLTDILEKKLDCLANRTPNGVLLPKRELEVEFNHLNHTVATWFRSLRIDPLFYQISCPIVCRVVSGHCHPVLDSRPYSTTKVHLDAWNGEPADTVNIILPILGDVASTAVEFFQTSSEIEEYLTIQKTYDLGEELFANCSRYPTHLTIGAAHFMDATVPHRTLKRSGGVRISLELRMRKQTPASDREKVEANCNSGRLTQYVSLSDWYCLGSDYWMSFKDTYKDALQGIFNHRTWNEPIYTVSVRP